MRRANSSIILVLLASFSASQGTVVSPPTISVPWTLPAERATLPEPFGTLVVKFSSPPNSAPRLSVVLVDGTVDVDESLLSDLSSPNLVEIVYSDPAQTTSKKVEYFELLILTGMHTLFDVNHAIRSAKSHWNAMSL